MTPSAEAAANLGFLTVLREPTGYVGGYLVVNSWGRPLEFRISSAVQPNRVQQILYGDSLEPYLCGDLIGKTLVEKTATPVRAVFTDHPSVLELRQRLELPVALVSADGCTDTCHPRFPDDARLLRTLKEKIGALDLAEPFARIREAVAEARKLGISGRNALAA